MLKTTCDGGHVSGFSADHEHDAAYAHALVLAIESIEVDGDVASLRDMRNRAAELMRAWGYGEVEDE